MLSLFGPIKVDILDADLPFLKLKPQRKLSRSSQAVTATVNGRTCKLRVRAVRRDSDGSTWAELLGNESSHAAILAQLEHNEARASLERRRALRDRVTLTVRSPDLPNFRGRTYDVSDTGMRIVTDGPVAVGTRVRLELDDRSPRGQADSVCAVAVWSRKRPSANYHVGVQLIS